MMRTLLFMHLSPYSFMLEVQSANVIDGIHTILKGKSCRDETRITTYIKLAYYYFNNSPQKSLRNLNTALEQAITSKKRSPFLSQIYLFKGTAYKKQSLNTEAIKNINSG